MLESIGLAIVFAVATALLTLGVYHITRVFAGPTEEQHTKDLASSVVFRISALHGLILALVFAQYMISYQQIKEENALEANALADIYFDAERYGSNSKVLVQDAVFAYVQAVTEEEWRSLAESSQLSSKAWAEWEKAYLAILDLVPGNDRQRSLREHMLKQVHVVAEMRVKRGNQGTNAVSGLFWFAAIAGVIFVAIAYHTFPPTRINQVLIGLFGAFTGLILFFIFAFENPLSPPGTMPPDAQQRLLIQLQGVRGG
jgi:hypothetical protein